MTGPLQLAARQAYRDNDWPAEEMEDETGFTFAIDGTDAPWSALAIVDDEEQRFVFYSLSPVDASEGNLARVAEYLHRANHGLVDAAFELDCDNGEIRLRSGLDFATLPVAIKQNQEALAALILDLSAANVGVFDRYLTGLVAVVAGNVAPAEVIAEIESD